MGLFWSILRMIDITPRIFFDVVSFFFYLPFSFCRLILSYERTYNDEKLNFCLGHNPAVTITFVCPSKRGEEVTLMF